MLRKSRFQINLMVVSELTLDIKENFQTYTGPGLTKMGHFLGEQSDLC